MVCQHVLLYRSVRRERYLKTWPRDAECNRWGLGHCFETQTGNACSVAFRALYLIHILYSYISVAQFSKLVISPAFPGGLPNLSIVINMAINLWNASDSIEVA